MGKDVLVDGRAVYVSGEIDDEMLDCRKQLRQLVLEHPSDPITLFINSVGGEVIGAFAILDEMESIRFDAKFGVQFVGVVQGLAASAALTILQGCDQRIAGSHSLLMAHGSRGGVTGDTHRRAAYERFITLAHERMARLYARRSTSNFGDWMRLFEDETPKWLSPAEALSLGLIDEIAGG